MYAGASQVALDNTPHTASCHPWPCACCIASSSRSRPWASSRSPPLCAQPRPSPYAGASTPCIGYRSYMPSSAVFFRNTGIFRLPVSPSTVFYPQCAAVPCSFRPCAVRSAARSPFADSPSTARTRSAYARPVPCNPGTNGLLSAAHCNRACTYATCQRPCTSANIPLMMLSNFGAECNHGFSPP